MKLFILQNENNSFEKESGILRYRYDRMAFGNRMGEVGKSEARNLKI